MTTILRIDSSSRTEGSVSRAAGDRLVALLTAKDPSARVVVRDLAADPIPHIVQETIAGYYAGAETITEGQRRATALSDALIGELFAADVLVLTVPMYNFSIPSALKAWIDQIVRVGRTFSWDGQAFAGLVGGRKAYVVSTFGAGGYGPGEAFAAANFVEPYLRFLLGFLGIGDVVFFPIEATTAAPDIAAANRTAAERAMEAALAA